MIKGYLVCEEETLGKMQIRKEIFISYAHQDEVLRDKLITHLSSLRWQGLIIDWYDRKISPGVNWENEIDIHLREAYIIILLISPDFMASPYCYGIEMKQALERHKAGDARVIPIILRPVYWEGASFDKLQVLPKGARPVTSWSNIDEAFLDIVQGIRKAIDDLTSNSLIGQSASRQVPYLVEEVVDSNRLYNTLVRLDYKEQVRVFQQFRNERRQIGAFLIYGLPSYGQGWLLNRLIKQLPNSSAILDFKFSFERKACGRSLKDLWSELAKWVGLKNLSSPVVLQSQQQEIIKRIHGLWQRHPVILMLSKLHEVDEQYIIKFMQEFWLPLSELAKDTQSQLSKYYLLMFLIDNADCIDKWSISVTKQIDTSWEPRVPIKLEKLSLLSHVVLNDWIGYELDTLPTDLTAQDILNNSEGGIPEFVLDHVCGLFGYEWSELIKYKV